MIPWLIAVLTLAPLNQVIFLYSRGLPQKDWATYFHFGGEAITGQGWLWPGPGYSIAGEVSGVGAGDIYRQQGELFLKDLFC